MTDFYELGEKNFALLKTAYPHEAIDCSVNGAKDKLTGTQMNFNELGEFTKGFENARDAFLRPYVQKYFEELDALRKKFNVTKEGYDDENEEYCDIIINDCRYPINKELLS